jgi:hypothetical protein
MRNMLFRSSVMGVLVSCALLSGCGYGKSVRIDLTSARAIAESELASVSGYKLRYGVDRFNLNKETVIASPDLKQITIEGLSPDTWYFSVSALDAQSNEHPLPVLMTYALGT